jgi:DUF4097 and DUF4098 domain-containing protein YvlB
MITALLTSMMMLACGSSQGIFAIRETKRVSSNFQERDEIKQRYQLASGARVEVSGIRGPVEISTDTGEMAEVHIIRTARTKADLENHKVIVEQTAAGLVVRGEQLTDRQQRLNSQVQHRVMLKLPRRINLTVNSVSGSVRIGHVDGQTGLKSISGSATIGHVGGALRANSISGPLDVGDVGGEVRVSSVSGNLHLGRVSGQLDVSDLSGQLSATLAQRGGEGIRIRSVSGSIELRFRGEVNADFNAEHISGNVRLDVPNVSVQGELKPPTVRARIGSGGVPITLTSVSGSIRLVRL